MNNQNFSMHAFRHGIYLEKPVEEVYKYIGTGNGLTKWFIGKSIYTSGEAVRRDSEYIKKGDKFTWHWLEKDLSINGTVLDAEINRLFMFTFGSLFNVTISVKKLRGRTLLTLEQEYTVNANHDDFAHINCCVCWVFFMTNLKSVIENGFDLRETTEDDEMLVNR